jgi:tetratricopeptide (TPR) repeat protein
VAGVFLVAGASIAAAQTGQAGQHDQHAGAPPDRVGSAHVDFRTSCAPAVKADFNRAVALLHSFWFPEARAAFQEVAKKDATCTMAHWGIGLTYWGNPFGGVRTASLIEQGQAAIAIGQKTGTPTPRERAYVDAVAGLFSSADPGTQRARVLAYEAAMEKIARENPTDVEAQIFWALAVNQTALPTDKTYAQNLKAAGILEPLFKKMPDHPGLAHYIIHAYDVPALAPKALPAARRYASLAPAVPHALHMPSHTFTRVGDWRDSISTNMASADAARAGKSSGDELHALDYQVYAYLQIAQDADASKAIARAQQVVSGAEGAAAGAAGAGAFALAAMPARYALERRQWAEAAQLQVQPASTPFTQAMTHFARAIGLARSGRPTAVPAELTAIDALRERLIAGKDPYWPEQLQIMRNAGEAWMHFAQGRRDAAITQMSATADAEDATDKSPISPGPLAPAREQLGYMLLEAGQAKAALAAFDAVMKKEPNRFLAIYGAAQASEVLKQTAAAQQYYRQLTTMCKDAPAGRKELDEARGKSK